MKKIIVALIAALGASVAFAQSSVQIYGIIDVGVIGGNYKGTGTSTSSTENFSTIGSNAESASRLGFRGQEDLGGGTSAIFTLETGLNPTNSTLSTFNTRQAWVGIKQNGIGSVTAGVQNTPVYNSVLSSDPGALNNIVGNVIFPSTPQNNGNAGLNPYYSAGSMEGTSDGFTVRTGNTISFISESYKGIQGQASVIMNNSTQSDPSVGGQNNNSGYGLTVNYTYNKFYITGAYQALRSNQTGYWDSNAAVNPSIWTGAGGGINVQDNQGYIAATYDFGPVKGYLQYITRTATDTQNSSLYAERTAQQIGVRGYITTRVEGWASVGNGRITEFTTLPMTNFVAYQVGANYWLSKRTNLYAIYGASNSQDTAVLGGNPALSATNYAVGMRHTF